MRAILFILILFSFATSTGQTHFYTSFDGVKIAYSDQGSGSPIILIHGFIIDASSWDRTKLKTDLLNKGYRVIVPDLRGNGASDKPHNADAYANDAEIKDLMGLADYLKLNHYDAVGYSRGSIVLAKLLTRDKRIKKAVLGGMGTDFTDPDWDRRKMFAEAFGGQAEKYPETLGAINYAKSIGADPLALHYLQEFQPVTSMADLHKVKAKVLVIAGDRDTDNGRPEDLQKAIPRSEFQLVEGDHNGAYTTQEFSGKILSFLKG